MGSIRFTPMTAEERHNPLLIFASGITMQIDMRCTVDDPQFFWLRRIGVEPQGFWERRVLVGAAGDNPDGRFEAPYRLDKS